MKKLYYQKTSTIFKPLLYISIVVIGVLVILFSLLFKEYTDPKYYYILSLSSDLGLGLFTAGLIGFVLATMEIQNKKLARLKQREAFIDKVDIALHNYINLLCELYHSKNSHVKKNVNFKKVLYYLVNLSSTSSDQITTEEMCLLLQLSKEISLFINQKPTFIATELFSVVEIDMFHMLSKQIKEISVLIQSENWTSAQRVKETLLSCLSKILINLPEMKCYLFMHFKNNNIQ